MSNVLSILREKFPSKEERIRKVQLLQDRMYSGKSEQDGYNDGAWDALSQVIIMIQEGEL